jgi:hypothetical protein
LIPDKAKMAMDDRAQENGAMKELLRNAEAAVANVVASPGTRAPRPLERTKAVSSARTGSRALRPLSTVRSIQPLRNPM